MPFRVVISDDRFGQVREEEAAFAGMEANLAVCHCSTEDEVIAAAGDADAVLLNQAPATERVIQALRKCRVISRYGIGYDNVDVAAATARGIWVANVPGYCADEVAEHALALMLACARAIPAKNAGVRAGAWNINRPLHRVAGRVLGVVGFGASGRALYEKAKAFGFSRILVADPRAREKLANCPLAEAASLKTLLEQADYISLHLPLKGETRHLIDSGAFALMKRGVVLVNTARGGIIDEAALRAALVDGTVRACGLDVLEHEPPSRSDPLLAFDNVIVTDHCAYYSEESIAVLKRKTAENAREVLLGRRPFTPVNVPLNQF